MAAEVPTFYDQWPQRLWMKVTVASSPEETESSLPLSLILASNSSSGHSSSLTVAICSSSCENLIRQRILIRICLANILWFHILCKQFTFFFFCRAFIASRFRRNFSLCSASLATRRDNNIREMQQKLPLWIFEKRRRLHKDISNIWPSSPTSPPCRRRPWRSRSSWRSRARSSASPSPSPSRLQPVSPPSQPCNPIR